MDFALTTLRLNKELPDELPSKLPDLNHWLKLDTSKLEWGNPENFDRDVLTKYSILLEQIANTLSAVRAFEEFLDNQDELSASSTILEIGESTLFAKDPIIRSITSELVSNLNQLFNASERIPTGPINHVPRQIMIHDLGKHTMGKIAFAQSSLASAVFVAKRGGSVSFDPLAKPLLDFDCSYIREGLVQFTNYMDILVRLHFGLEVSQKAIVNSLPPGAIIDFGNAEFSLDSITPDAYITFRTCALNAIQYVVAKEGDSSVRIRRFKGTIQEISKIVDPVDGFLSIAPEFKDNPDQIYEIYIISNSSTQADAQALINLAEEYYNLPVQNQANNGLRLAINMTMFKQSKFETRVFRNVGAVAVSYSDNQTADGEEVQAKITLCCVSTTPRSTPEDD